jgi:UDPglucose--hexose-1-phosphate uridylyltransferase
MYLQEDPHRRYNPLTGEWVKVSPHRTKRPWQGQVEDGTPEKRPEYDPKCYLCPGNERAGGVRTEQYKATHVFDNDFAALLSNTDQNELNEAPFIKARTERGICRVICFSPRHDLTLSLMERESVTGVVKTWQEQFRDLAKRDFINHIQIFENRGAVMGCSNPHPHGQIWAEELIPDLPRKELENQEAYFAEYGRPLLEDYLNYELKTGERLVFSNRSFVALVPFWAVWPYEVMILPRNQHGDITTLSLEETADLADALVRMGIRFDNLFKTSFPYSMGLHQKPTDGQAWKGCRFHLHYFPPLLRSATVKKFMVGYEMLGMPQRDITAEMAAAKLRECPEIHFTRGVF